MSHQTAATIIYDGAGRHFDPDVVLAFRALEDEFDQIAQRFSDSEPAEPLTMAG
ncbi:hypothetical protein D3C86_2063170 [compost metagenome]